MQIGDFSDVRSDNVVALHDRTAGVHPERVAIDAPDATLTHAELRDRSATVAGGLLEMGLEPGDRIGLYAPNSAAYVIAALAALKAGTPLVPLNPQFRSREVAYRLADADAAGLIVHRNLLDRAADAIREAGIDPEVIVDDADHDISGDTHGGAAADGGLTEVPAQVADPVAFGTIEGEPYRIDCEPDDVALQPYTSGTTGEPKGVLLTHRNLRSQSLIGFERTELDADEERFLSWLPLSHIAGFVNRTWQPLIRGATVYLRDPGAWDAGEAMTLIESERITKFGAVTAMYVDLINHDSFGEHDLSSLQEAMEGGDTMPTAVQRRFEEATGVELFEAYGLTETGGGTHVGFGSTFGPRRGTIGQPLRATDCKIVDEDGREVQTGEPGELLVRGPHVMAGYHGRPEETEAAFTREGYFRTGDVARRDEDNYYEIVDRKSDMIVTAGYNVYPAEVEEVLHEHPGVRDVAVVGVPDERRNTTVKAYVVPDTERRPTEQELRDHCLDELAPYKHPRTVEFVETLPRTTSGKVQRFRLEPTADELDGADHDSDGPGHDSGGDDA